MPAVLCPVTYEPVKAVRVLSSQGSTPQLIRLPEDATQTWQVGVPVRLVSGYIQECAFSGADIIVGFSSEKAKNYASAGGGATFGLPPTLPAAIDLNDPASGAPPNQPSAVVVPIGAALRDGLSGIYAANGQTVFSIALQATQVFTLALVIPGTLYGLVKDSTTGFWYLDSTDTTGNNAVASIIGVDQSCPNTSAGGSRVFIQIAAAKRMFA